MTLVTATRAELDLAGTWEIVFDPAAEGLAQGWVSGNWPSGRSKPVTVPRVWNVDFPDAEGVGFYRTAFAVPLDWKGRPVFLHFGGASYTARVWVNGAYVGSHEGAYTPFEFDITPFVRFGSEHELIVRIAALSKTKQVDGMVLQHSPTSKQSWYYVYGGLWGEVCVQARSPIAIQSIAVEPNMKCETVRIDIAVRNQHADHRPVDLRLCITGPRGDVVFDQTNSATILPGESRYSYRASLPRPLPWSCDTPNLYLLEAQVCAADGQRDAQATHFGMRDFTAQNGEFFLNGEPIFLRGVLLQPNYPINLVTPPDPEMMEREVRLAKEAGFNLIRTHLRPAPPGFLDWTDRLGMLVYAETSLAWIRDSPRLLEHGRREIQALVERDHNHPSVVVWGIFNENPRASAIAGDALVPFARTLDPSRVVVDNSGASMAIDQDFGWVDRATLLPSRETERQRVLDVHLYLGGYVPQPVYDWLRRLGAGVASRVLVEQDYGSNAVLDEFDREQRTYQGKVFVSELGCGGMSDLDKTVSAFGGREDLLDAREFRIFRDSLQDGFKARRLERIFGSVGNLVHAAQQVHAAADKRQIEAILCNSRISGYVLSQLNDVAWEFHAGLLDLWRTPKLAFHAVKRLNQAHCLVLRAAAPGACVGDRIDVALTLVDRSALRGTEQVSWTVTDPAGKEMAAGLRQAPPGTGIKDVEPISFFASQAAGTYSVAARLLDNHAPMAESTETVLVLQPVDWTRLPQGVEWPGGPFNQTDLPPNPRVVLAPEPGSLTAADWENLFDRVHAGQCAIVGPLHPRHELALRALAQRGIPVQLFPAIGSWMGCYHWIPSSKLFHGLPAGGLAGEEYVDVLPWYSMSEHGEAWAGSLRNTQTRLEPPAMLWYADIQAVRLGAGLIILCQYRIFDKVKTNPLAARLAFNLILVHDDAGGRIEPGGASLAESEPSEQEARKGRERTQ